MDATGRDGTVAPAARRAALIWPKCVEEALMPPAISLDKGRSEGTPGDEEPLGEDAEPSIALRFASSVVEPLGLSTGGSWAAAMNPALLAVELLLVLLPVVVVVVVAVQTTRAKRVGCARREDSFSRQSQGHESKLVDAMRRWKKNLVS